MIREYLSLDLTTSRPKNHVFETCCLLYKLFQASHDSLFEPIDICDKSLCIAERFTDHSLRIFERTIGPSEPQSFEGFGTDSPSTTKKQKTSHFKKFHSIEKLISNGVIDDEGRESLQRELLNPICDALQNHDALKTEETFKRVELFLESIFYQKGNLEKAGKLLWVIDNKPELFLEQLDQEDNEHLSQWLDEIFESEMEKLVYTLKDSVKLENVIDIQSSEVIVNTRIPVEISRFIITETGAINTGLLKYMQHLFTGDNEVVFNHDISIKQTLELFLKSETLRDTFEEIRTPKNPHSRIATVIRLSLGMSPGAPISSVDAKRAVMAALLSHLRQYANRSCFAAFLAIQLKQSYLEDCIKDLISLLDNGHLTREIDGTTRHFPFLMKMNNPYLHHEFQVNSEGQVIKNGAPIGIITESSGLMAANVIMGSPHPEESLLNAVHGMEGIVTPNAIIERLAQNTALKSGNVGLAGKYYHEGCFAFGSKVLNPLLKVWVNTIAGMAEGQANCYFSSCLIKSTLQVFHKHLIQNFPEFSELIEAVEENVCKDLALSIRYMYDPSIGFTVSVDEGGFVLYEANREGTRLKRIDNATMFKEFVLRTLDKSKSRCDSEETCLLIIETLKQFVKSSGFTKSLNNAYKTLIRGTYEDLDETDKVTPWMNLFGHNASAILKVYFENEESFNTYGINSKSGFHLLNKLIQMGKKLTPEEQNQLAENPYTLKPVRIVNYHAFSLILGHSSFKEVWAEETDPKKWLHDKILNPGREIAALPISPNQRKQLCALFPDIKLQQLPKKTSIHKFRKALLKLIPDKSSKTAMIMDHKIVQTLDPSLKKRLKETLIHFADTNLHSGVQDVHFCFLVNPGSGRVEVWQVNDDDTELKPLDQQEITVGKTWEIYLHPDKLL